VAGSGEELRSTGELGGGEEAGSGEEQLSLMRLFEPPSPS
jgi:hypothetical protein